MNFKKRSFIFSVLAHAGVVLFACLQWDALPPPVKHGARQSKALTTYIYQANFAGKPARPARLLQNKPLSKQEKLPTSDSTLRPQTQFQSSNVKPKINFSNKKQPSPLPTPQITGNNRPVPELIAMLHTAIQKQQRYPASALQMERQGNATVTFMLFPTGDIDRLEIIKSSGTAALDEAAVTAIHHALPFKGVAKYISTPQKYQITVAFKLT